MAEKNENKLSLFERIRKKRQISVIDEHTYEQRWSTQLSILNIFTLVGLFTLVIIAITYMLLTFTPMQYFVTGENEKDFKSIAIENKRKLDSINRVVQVYKDYTDRMKILMSGGTFKEDTMYLKNKKEITADSLLNLDPSREDSVFRNQMQEDVAQQSFSKKENIASIQGVFFYSPITGKISKSFNGNTHHLGTDIIGKKGDAVKATLDGTVIYSGYTVDDGNLIIVSHGDNLQSVYKHNEKLLKKVGDHVAAGDPIALIGNTGENTSGYHVHFEIWHNGEPVNPENYISF